MSKIKMIEPIVADALIYHPETRGDNFLLYIEVLRRFINVSMPMEDVFRRHKELGIPSLETITRIRRKLQESFPFLRDAEADEMRRREQEEHYNYSKSK